MKDTYHDNKAVPALAPAVVTAAANGVAVDLAGFDSALFVINTGAIVGDGDFSVKLQESDTADNANFADVADADQLGTIPATLAANSAYRVGYIGSKAQAICPRRGDKGRRHVHRARRLGRSRPSAYRAGRSLSHEQAARIRRGGNQLRRQRRDASPFLARRYHP